MPADRLQSEVVLGWSCEKGGPALVSLPQLTGLLAPPSVQEQHFTSALALVTHGASLTNLPRFLILSLACKKAGA